MRFAPSLTLLALGAFAASAHAGQIFSFQNPIPSGSYDNSMFETKGLAVGNTGLMASIQNLYAGNVSLVVTNFSSAGVQQGAPQSYSAKYYLSKSAYVSPTGANSVFQGNRVSGSYSTGAGFLTFVNPTDATDVLLTVSFDASSLAYGNLAAAGTIAFGGRLKTTGETGNENASFGFPDAYTDPAGTTALHRTASYTSSIGAVAPVPEPSTCAALALGGLAALRRRRRA